MASSEGRVPARSVDEAIAREGDRRYEDRLTEVLATALDKHPPLAHALMKAAGVQLDAEGITFRVRTQRAFSVVADPSRTRSTDLEIVALAGEVPVGRLWCENKLDSRERKEQLDDQYDALQAAAPAAQSSRLLAIVPIDRDRREINERTRVSKAFDVKVLTWLELNDLVRRVGMHSAGAAWPDSGRAELATTESWGVLCNLLEEIAEHGGVLASEPLTAADLSALAQINETMKRLRWLLWQVFDSPRAAPYMRRSSNLPEWRDPDSSGLTVHIDIGAPLRPCWIDNDDIKWTRFAAISANSDGDPPAILEVGLWAWAEPVRTEIARRGDWRDRLASYDFELELESQGAPDAQKAWVWRDVSLFEVLDAELIPQRDAIAASVSQVLSYLERQDLAP